jgi:hypothetical protein
MAKTKPIGVRFNKEVLESTGLTPQKALNKYEEAYIRISEGSNVQSVGVEKKADSDQLTRLKKELAAIPDKTKGMGRLLASTLERKIRMLESL